MNEEQESRLEHIIDEVLDLADTIKRRCKEIEEMMEEIKGF